MSWPIRGVCLDALNPAGAPSPTRLARLAGAVATGHRLVVTDDPRCTAYLQALGDADMQTALVLTADSYAATDDATLTAQTAQYAATLQPALWIVGNEWNVANDASWPAGDDAFVAVWNRVAPVLHDAQPGVPVAIGGMYSEPGVLDHLDRVLARLGEPADALDLHLYQEASPIVELILRDARTRVPRVGMGEWNWMAPNQIGRFQGLLNRTTDYSFWYCWSDGQVAGMGLVGASGRRKLVYGAYRRALAGHVV